MKENYIPPWDEDSEDIQGESPPDELEDAATRILANAEKRELEVSGRNRLAGHIGEDDPLMEEDEFYRALDGEESFSLLGNLSVTIRSQPLRDGKNALFMKGSYQTEDGTERSATYYGVFEHQDMELHLRRVDDHNKDSLITLLIDPKELRNDLIKILLKELGLMG